jgi:hypothetical protein
MINVGSIKNSTFKIQNSERLRSYPLISELPKALIKHLNRIMPA